MSQSPVELKFSSHRRGWDYLACGELCEFGFGRRVALARRAVEPEVLVHTTVSW